MGKVTTLAEMSKFLAITQKLTASDGSEGQNFGGRSSLSSHYAIVCALYDADDFESGATYVFKREGTNWVEMEKHTSPGGDYFGWNTSVFENVFVVGAHASDVGAASGGAAYVYDLPVVSSVEPLHHPSVEISLAPNPAQDYLVIQTELRPESYSILNAEGKTIKAGMYTSDQLFVGDLAPGLYFLESVFSNWWFGHL